jgi:hypothetical protein
MVHRHPGVGSSAHRARQRAAPQGADPVLALQRVVGNRGTGQLLARKPAPGTGTFEVSVRIGRLGPIEVKESNVGDWIAGKSGAGDVTLTTAAGKQAKELQRLAGGGKRIDAIEIATVTGQNSWTVVTFKNAVIKGFAADAASGTEQWTLTRFDRVDIKRTSIGQRRP